MKSKICDKCREPIANCAFNKHYSYCDGSGKRKSKGVPKGTSWNKGLTKADPRVAKNAIATSAALTGRPGKKHTEEEKAHLSVMARKNGFGGTTQSRWIEYNGIKLGSSYEVKVAIDLDAHRVKWEKPRKFDYIDPKGKSRTYTPDFYLPDFDVYLDPKNDFLINNPNPSLGFCDVDKIKLVEEQNKIRVLILSKSHLNWESIKGRLEMPC